MTLEMVEVHFAPAGAKAWVQSGITILAASEAAGVEIITGCAQGMCGTDPVRIAEGAGGLSEPEEHEQGTLERMGLATEYRLSCSAKILSGPVFIETDAF
ncbi:MAG: 2Fe-2S iron-sulfur cluster-binding protein [Planctomycetota bacterium]|jgi:ferredoxin